MKEQFVLCMGLEGIEDPARRLVKLRWTDMDSTREDRVHCRPGTDRVVSWHMTFGKGGTGRGQVAQVVGSSRPEGEAEGRTPVEEADTRNAVVATQRSEPLVEEDSRVLVVVQPRPPLGEVGKRTPALVEGFLL